MAQNISIGIDVGTSSIRVIALQSAQDRNDLEVRGGANTKDNQKESTERSSYSTATPRVIGIGYGESRGLRNGYVTNATEATKSINEALKGIKKVLGDKPGKVCIALGGIGLSGNIFQSSVSLSKSEMEVTEADVARVSDVSRSDMPQTFALNRQTFHSFPLQYKVDGRTVPGRPHGLKGAKLDARTLFISCLAHHINEMVGAVEEAGVDVEDIVAAPIARGNCLLSKAEKNAGVILADIGSETVSLVVYESGSPLSLEVLQIGSGDITNDIALGFKVNLQEAENLKRGISTPSSKKKLDEIITARLSDIFELIENHLKKIGKDGLLPAGIVLCGGGSEIHRIEEIARLQLKLPVRKVTDKLESTSRGSLKLSEWGGAYGAALFQLTPDDDEETFGIQKGIELGKGAGKGLWEWIKQYLP